MARITQFATSAWATSSAHRRHPLAGPLTAAARPVTGVPEDEVGKSAAHGGRLSVVAHSSLRRALAPVRPFPSAACPYAPPAREPLGMGADVGQPSSGSTASISARRMARQGVKQMRSPRATVMSSSALMNFSAMRRRTTGGMGPRLLPRAVQLIDPRLAVAELWS